MSRGIGGSGSPDGVASSDRLASPPVSARCSSSSKARCRDWTPPSRPFFSAGTVALLTSALSFRYAETIVRLVENRRAVIQRSEPSRCFPMSSEVQVLGEPVERGDEILTPEALDFLAGLHDAFAGRRDELLQARGKRREEARTTGRLDFLPETKEIREGDWAGAGAPAALRDRRVEITGPTDRKMTINALNSGAKVWLADLEDANTPHWANVVSGQENLHAAIRRTIRLQTDAKTYELGDGPYPTIVVRPRGWHL